MSDLDCIVRLRIELTRKEPAFWRVVEVPVTTTLRALHDIIQAAMPRTNAHLYLFVIGDERYGESNPEYGTVDREAKSLRPARLLNEGLEWFTRSILWVYSPSLQ